MSYGKKTVYRIERVDTTVNAYSTFKKGDEELSFIQYYKTTYNKTICNPKLPLLLVKLSKKDIRRGLTKGNHLVPEFCQMFGK